jgi:alkylhydroperoxidase family enzyme
MSRITPIQANGVMVDLKPGPGNSRLRLAKAPRFLQVMAHSTAALRAYILADAALVRGQLTRRQRQQVARMVAEINGSSSSLSADYDAGRNPGLIRKDMQLARKATAADPKAESMLRFTQAVVLQRGEVSDDDFQALVKAGFTDAQIIEIVANIALDIFADYFNNVIKTRVGDFPPQPGLQVPRVGIVKSPTQPAALKARSRKPLPKGR